MPVRPEKTDVLSCAICKNAAGLELTPEEQLAYTRFIKNSGVPTKLLPDKELFVILLNYLQDKPLTWRQFKKKYKLKPTKDLQQKRRTSISLMRYITIAATTCIISTVGIYLFRNHVTNPSKNNRIKAKINGSILNPPAQTRAELILSDNTIIKLDSMSNSIITQGNSCIKKFDTGGIQYQYISGSGNKTYDTGYNTLSTPLGGVFKVKLPDGSCVNLNPRSVIRYPVSFAGSNRSVQLVTGEAYFNIAKDPKRSFYVYTKNATMTVIGTEFNIDAYSDSAVVTTLIHGSLKINNEKEELMLRPGEQCTSSQTNSHLVKTDSNVIKNINARKIHLFSFDNESITNIMQQVERWYDVHILYKGDLSKIRVSLIGNIPSSTPLNELLWLLSRDYENFHYEIRSSNEIILSK